MNSSPVFTGSYPKKIPTESGGEIPPNGKRPLTCMNDLQTEIREAMLSGLPSNLQGLLRDIEDDESFAEYLTKANQWYIDTYIKPCEEAINQYMNDLCKKLAEYGVPVDIKLKDVKEEIKDGWDTEVCKSLL